jgi:FkbM family methyltransferase
MHRSEVLRRVARTWPAVCRPPVRLVAGSRLSCHWLVNALLRDLGIYDTTPAYLESLDLYVPRPLVDFYRNMEPLTRQAFRHALAPGMTVVDVGAHVGSYTAVAAHAVGRRGVVYAIEPGPDSRELLARNVRHHHLHNVVVLPCAAGRTTRSRVFHLETESTLHGFYAHPLSQGAVRTIEVQERPLDEVIPGSVDVMKIDVEGAEIEVLDGARRLLRRSGGASLFVEWNPACLVAAGHAPADLPARLSALGFSRVRVLDDRAGREREIGAVLAEVRTGGLGPSWYTTLWASRQ